MSTETMRVSAELVNAAFIDKLDNGLVKEAQEAGSAFIRQQLYEEGFLRRLFEPRTVTADELDPQTDSDKPSIIVEKEPGASSATFVPFKGTGERAYFNGARFRVPFGKIEAERMTKSKFELMTIRMDIMTWLKENQVKMIQQQEDGRFISTVNSICSANAAAQILTPSVSSLGFKNCFTKGLQALTTLRQPIGKILMSKNTYLSSLSLKVDEIGYKAQDARWERGVDGETSIMGYPVVTTIKNDLCPDNTIYFFAPQQHFCSFYLLQDATLFLKYEADMIDFHTYEAPGIGIGNTLGVVKVVLS